MLERDVELETLVAAFDRARQGQGSTVLVSGEARSTNSIRVSPVA